MVGRYKAKEKLTYEEFYDAYYKEAKANFTLKMQKVDKRPVQMKLPLKYSKCNIMV